MGKQISQKDDWVRALCADANYRILPSGEVLTLVGRDGRVQQKWRSALCKSSAGQKHKRTRYVRVNYKYQRLAAHRIVWCKHGATELDPFLTINHIDGNPENNDIRNLEQVTKAANNLHAYRVLKRPTRKKRAA